MLLYIVYGRENRLRVARDEKEFAEKKEKERAERQEREREARYRALHAKGSKNVVVLDGTDGVVQEKETGVVKKTGLGQGVERRGGERWKRGREKAEEDERRGDPLTRTSDAAFDQSFRFAKGMQERPWWCGGCLNDGGRGSALGARRDEASLRQKEEHQEEEVKNAASRSCLGYVKVMDARETRVIQRNEEKKSKRKKESKEKVYDSLRQERLAREAGERDKAERVMMRYT